MLKKAHVLFLVFLACTFFTFACQSTKPLPQPRQAIDPATAKNAIQTPRWDIGALGYTYPGQGLNYSKAGLDPVLLIVKNKTNETPVVLVEEMRGVGADGEYLVYSRQEAVRLLLASETPSLAGEKAGKDMLFLTLLGAGVGALIGSIDGGDNVWKGLLTGAGTSLLAGAAVSAGVPASEGEALKELASAEIGQYEWKETKIPPHYTRTGYLYFPAQKDITALKLVVRIEGEVLSYTVPVERKQPTEAKQRSRKKELSRSGGQK